MTTKYSDCLYECTPLTRMQLLTFCKELAFNQSMTGECDVAITTRVDAIDAFNEMSQSLKSFDEKHRCVYQYFAEITDNHIGLYATVFRRSI